jgi:hypothetical protein
MTMICRDESINFKSNLNHWFDVVDYFVFLIDSRTSDDSVTTLHALFKTRRLDYKIKLYNFTGFGDARTLSLTEAFLTFPNATHVLIADPDWFPLLHTINKNELDLEHDVFRFTIYDRNEVTTRKMDWLLKHRKGLKMRYNLHEVLDIGNYSAKVIGWEVKEIEKKGTWHTTIGHAHSMSAKRYLFDLQLLSKDLSVYGHDPHTHYYLGITYQAYVEKVLETATSDVVVEVQNEVDLTIKYLLLRIYSEYEDDFIEERWAAMYILGLTYFNYKVSWNF